MYIWVVKCIRDPLGFCCFGFFLRGVFTYNFFLVMDFRNIISVYKATILRHMYDEIRVKSNAYLKKTVLILCIMIASKKKWSSMNFVCCVTQHIFFHLLQIYRLKETDFAGIKRWKFRTAWKNMWYHDRQNKEEPTNLNYGISLSNPETLKYQKRPIRWFLVEHLYHGGVKQQDGFPNWPFIVVTATIIPVISACTCTLCR